MKKIYLLLIAFTTLFLGTINVKAATAEISVYASTNKVVVGKTFKITVKISSSAVLGAWEYTLNYDSSNVSLVSSDVPLHYVGYGNGTIKSKSYSYTFKALKSGSVRFYVNKTSVIDWNENTLAVTNGSRTVSIITQSELEASYSKNNNLSALSISSYEISPIFNKDVTTYSATVPSTVTKITINATKEDKTASISGIGEFDVSEGLNTFLVKVTAQNGNVKTYTLNVNVEDLNPIKVKINNKEYIVIKRLDLVTCPSTYLETNLTINNITIPGCKNDISKYNLVALKDSEGNTSLFIYDALNNSYKKYQELTFTGLIFNPLVYDKKIDDYEIIKIKINNEEVSGYNFKENSDFVLLYGKNIETGQIGFYIYDKEENTLQRYNDEHIISLKKDLKDYLIIIVIFGIGLLVTIMASIMIIFNKKKLTKKKNIIKKENEKEPKKQ